MSDAATGARGVLTAITGGRTESKAAKPSVPSSSVAVVGGGTFGRALAQAIARNGHQVILISRNAQPGLSSDEQGLDEIRAPAPLVTSSFAEVQSATLVLIAVRSTAILDTADALEPYIDGGHLLVHVSRGLRAEEDARAAGPRREVNIKTLSSVLSDRTACRRVGALAGPLVADGIARGLPGGGIVGSPFPEVVEAVRAALGSATLRIYATHDLVGLEIASAMVGLASLVAGFATALGIGPSALAVVCSRAMAEAERVGVALGGDPKTFAGLGGYGDLVASLAGDQRPEFQLGVALARGETLRTAAQKLSANIEGVAIAHHVARFARDRDIEAPIATVTAGVLDATLTVSQAVEHLMTRQIGRSQ